MIETCFRPLEHRPISVAATLMSCAFTVLDATQTIFSVGTNPVFFGLGAFVGFGTSFHVNEGSSEMAGKAIYSLIIGTLPSPLIQISAVAKRYFGSPLVLGFRCGAMFSHTFYHLQR